MKFLRLVVSVALLAATAAGAGGVCDADADVTSWRETPYNNLHELDGSLIRVQVKLPDTNTLPEYNEIYHSATDSFLSHFYADGRMNTLLTYFTYETFDKLRCADDPAFLKQFNSVRRLRYDYIMSIFSFRYIDDNETVRGVPVDHWHYCWDGDYSQDLYFPR
ncbi:hypothetical protein LSAT2_006536 [Lamellibrachia satsuma]|nr:hypothetical protein LSAT2_006536 [Lamellibrachia satsuma]